MPKSDEVLGLLLLSYPATRSLTEVSVELDLDNDSVSRSLKALKRCGLCEKRGSKWVIPNQSFERAKQYFEKIMDTEDSLEEQWKEAIEMRRYDRSLSIANKMITTGHLSGMSSKAISLLCLDHANEALLFAEKALLMDDLYPNGWSAAADHALRMNYRNCAKTFMRVAIISQARMDTSA